MSGAVHMDPRQHCTGSPLFQMGFTLSSSLFRSSFSSLRAQHLGRQLSGALISRQGNSSSMMLFSPNCILDGILMDFCLAVGPRYACWSLWPWPCSKGGTLPKPISCNIFINVSFLKYPVLTPNFSSKFRVRIAKLSYRLPTRSTFLS